MSDPIVLSVVVAAYNEEPVIVQNMLRVLEQLASHTYWTYELICINDGSTDRTGELLDLVAARHGEIRVLHQPRNLGQGRALRDGFKVCRGGIVITLDADLSYSPECIPRLVSALLDENADIALASPYMRGGAVHNVPWHRHLLSRFGNAYLARMSPHAISTSTCVVRAYRREALANLVLTSNGMELQLEVLRKAAIVGYRVCEVPARLEWPPRKAESRRRSKMPVFRSIGLYLLLGWLSRPAFAFIVGALTLIVPSLYIAAVLLWRLGEGVVCHWKMGWNHALSNSLRDLYGTYSYSIIIFGFLLVIGLHLFAIGMLLFQNAFYFEEQYRISQRIITVLNALKAESAREGMHRSCRPVSSFAEGDAW